MADAREDHDWGIAAFQAAWTVNIWLPKNKQVDPEKIKPRRVPIATGAATERIKIKPSQMFSGLGGKGERCSPQSSNQPSSTPKK